MLLAAKGGFNNESHNHNDVGTFSLYVNTIPVFIGCRSRYLYQADVRKRPLYYLDHAKQLS